MQIIDYTYALTSDVVYCVFMFAVNAYLCQPDYFQALLVCLRAVEQNRPALLAEVNPELV